MTNSKGKSKLTEIVLEKDLMAGLVNSREQL